MFHPNTEWLIDTWRAHREGRALPARADLSPIDLGPLLPQIFMLGCEGENEVFRLCGGQIAEAFGRDLRGSALHALWSTHEQPMVADALTRARRAAAPVVITADAETEVGTRIGVELCLAPLIGTSGVVDRTVGLFQPISLTGRVMGQKIVSLALRSAVVALEPHRPAQHGPTLKLVAMNGRRVA